MSTPQSKRWRWLAGLLIGIGAPSCGGQAPESPLKRADERVFVIGFDGMDPTLTRQWMDEGKLPNLKTLADEGTFSTLESTQPSESPTAWSSFATGVNPGQHNIYDFLIRDTQTYEPRLNMVRREPPTFLWGAIPTKGPSITSTRGGTSFWVTAGQSGIKTTVMTVPVTFPAEPIDHGRLLAGLPTPDLRGTLGTYYYFGTDVSRFEERSSEFLGISRRLAFEGDRANTLLMGPPNPIVKQELEPLNATSLSDQSRTQIAELEARKDVQIPLSVQWHRSDRRATIEVGGNTFSLKQGEWSEWIPLTFKINFLVSVDGMMQFYLANADTDLRLYGSPINIDPGDPAIPISSPSGFAAELAERVGPYRTLGWAESADKPLDEGRLDEQAFLDDANRAMDDRERLIFEALKDDDWDLFVSAIETTDRVSHMMWRLIDPAHPMYDAALATTYGDAIEKIYIRADNLVGRLRAAMPADATFIVMSDHGFHSFRRSVNLNTWLMQNGYLTFEGEIGETKTLDDLFNQGQFFTGVDWSRTRAYAVGLGQIYFNQRGREAEGTVSPGAEYLALQEEMRAKLLTLRDPENDALVFGDIYRRDDIYHGEFLDNAPDLQVGFNDGYRVGWQDTLGSISTSVIEDNMRKWSGDHCATVAEISGGVLFINRKLTSDKPSIMDLAPTILDRLGVAVPAGLDGRVLR